MSKLSNGVQFAWRIAAAEAVKSGHEFIEPGHMLIGICKIAGQEAELRKAMPDEPEQIPLPLLAESRSIRELFESFNLDRVLFYRELRKRLGAGPVRGKDRPKMKRSGPTRHAFDEAEKLAAASPLVNSLHLLTALLCEDKGGISSLLKLKGVEDARLKSAALRAASTDFPPAELARAATPVEITETFDPAVSTFNPAGLKQTDHARRLSLLYEFPLQLATATQLSGLLQIIVERLLEVIPGATRGALLLVDPSTGSLVLEAHLPIGEPAVSMTLAQRAITRRESFIWNETEHDKIASASFRRIGTGMYAPLLWAEGVQGVICVDNPDREITFAHDDLQLLMAVARYAAMAVAHRRALEDLRRYSELADRLFSFRFAPPVRASLLRAAAASSLPVGTRQSHITVLVSDIRGFTELTARIGAQRVNDLLNEYFPPLIKVIHEHQGTVELLAGDAIFAVFGSPEPDNEQHEHAVRAGLAMQSTSEAIMKSRAAQRIETCAIGIGVDCGEALHGFIGNAERLEYTVIGKPANSASRYCHGAGRGEILVSPEVHARIFHKLKSERIEIQTKDHRSLVAFRILREVNG